MILGLCGTAAVQLQRKRGAAGLQIKRCEVLKIRRRQLHA
jgi:hypothetical protein